MKIVPRLWLLSVALCGSAQAAFIPTYDLDTLVWQSDAIVAARIDSAQKRGYDLTVKASVTRAYAGRFPVGRKLTLPYVELYSVSVAPKPRHITTPDGKHITFLGDEESRDLARGDTVIAFYWRPNESAAPPFVRTLYLVRGGKISTFYQRNNPGGLDERPTGQTLGDWEKTLAQTQTRLATWKRELALPARPQDASRWLSRLQGRKAALETHFTDPITSALAIRVAACGDLTASERALFSVRFQGRPELINAFNTPAGRAFLSRRVADQSVSRATRLQLLRVLASNSAIWSSSFGGAREDAAQLLGFLAGQTQTARSDPHFARELVLAAQGLARRAASGRFPTLRKQLNASLPLWREVRATAARPVQKEIDRLGRIAHPRAAP